MKALFKAMAMLIDAKIIVGVVPATEPAAIVAIQIVPRRSNLSPIQLF